MNWQDENRRAAYLQFLYELDGRDQPDHPMRGLLTGLYQARARQLVELDRKAVTGG